MGILIKNGTIVTALDEINRYVCLMFVFGSFLDQDPLVPWAGRILRSDYFPSNKLDLLFERSASYLEDVAGIEGQHYRLAMRRAASSTFDDLTKASTGDLFGDAREVLGRLYRRKLEALAPDDMRALLEHAEIFSTFYDMDVPETRLLFLQISFLAGTFFYKDPQHPWTIAPLSDRASGRGREKARELHRAARNHVCGFLTADAGG